VKKPTSNNHSKTEHPVKNPTQTYTPLQVSYTTHSHLNTRSKMNSKSPFLPHICPVRPLFQRGVIPIPPCHQKPRRSQFWGKERHFRKRLSQSFRRFVFLSPPSPCQPLLVLAEEGKAKLWFLFCHFPAN
jgi:hypothetical protein